MRSRMHKYKGKAQRVCDWERELGLRQGAISQHLRKGWIFSHALEEALKLKAKHETDELRTYKYHDEQLTFTQLAAIASRTGLSAKTLYSRLRKGMCVVDAVETPPMSPTDSRRRRRQRMAYVPDYK